MSAPELKPCPFCGDTMETSCAGYANHTHQNPLCPISQMGFTELLKWNTRADLCDSTQDERVKALVGLLREAREDIAVYVDADYPEISRAKYPDIQRRWHRDTELCRRIDTALRDMEPDT